jgi:Fe-S cluster assembly iron-binding protein IscA
MIRMTARAAQELKSELTGRSLPEDTPLRVEVQPSDEGKAMLSLGLDRAAPREGDQVAVTEGARLVVQEEVAEVLGESELDFREDSFVVVRLPATQ